ncbi:MAG: wax ester/triacylglycerol synthase family O-acyltransferase [Gammaproteobacteria bacterium]|nr:wax ester/triacylglycerol synthase family O-acyltransferase [Gammaproteobacteria bacterium]MCP5197994.1 wax ester/triacylglycerol synthase family O-acyltransferase [Gammaproteobacteria bacterium]
MDLPMPKKAESERISGIDTAWLRMERPTNLMMITGVIIFAERLDYDRLRAVIEQRFLKYRRFTQRAVQKNAGAFWESDAYFDIRRHLLRTALPGCADKIGLQHLASDLMSTPLDFSKPLWQFHLVEDYQGGSALILRIHHCYADGIALIHVLLSLTDPAPGTRPPAPAEKMKRVEEAGIFQRFFEPVDKMVSATLKLGRGLLSEGFDIIRHPVQVLDYARNGVRLAAEVAQLASMSDDSHTCFKGELGVTKRVAWAEPLDLSEIKAIGKALGGSVNDVLLAVVAGALRDYLLERGDPVPEELQVRAVIPVNLRPLALEQAAELGNCFGLVFLALPVGIANPLKRVYEVRRRMNELKASYQPILALGLLGAAGMGPNLLQQSLLEILSKKASAVMTNVPGPQQAIALGGARIAEMMFWVPQSGQIGIGVSILSYHNRVHFGLVVDGKLVDAPEAVINRFAGEFEKLLFITLMSPWGQNLDAEQIERSFKVFDASGSRTPG